MLVLPFTSVAILVNVVVPTANALPDAGLETIVGLPQLSVPVTVNVIIAVQVLISAFIVISDGQVIEGDWLSTTVTVNEQVLILPYISVAVPVTVVIQVANILPQQRFDYS